MSDLSVLQNDPNEGLRLRLESDSDLPSAQDTLTIVLHDLHEAARTRLAAEPERPRRHRRRH